MTATLTTVPCTSCSTRLKRPDKPGVKALKCPKCGTVVKLPGETPPPPAPVSAPPAADSTLLSLPCSACPTKLKVRAELAGKSVKCPRCGKLVKVPSPAAPPAAPPPAPPPAPAPAAEEEWLDINEAAAAPEPVVTSGGRTAPAKEAPTGDWGQELLKSHGIPKEMQEKFRTTLTKNERILWFDRPRMDILMHKARKVLLRGCLVLLLALGGLPAGGWYLYTHQFRNIEPKHAYIFLGILGFMAVLMTLVGIYSLFAPLLQRRGAATRACFALTNRRLLIHLGSGAQQMHGRDGSVNVVVGAGKMNLLSYSGFELARMGRIEMRRFPGCGDLIFRRNLLDDSTGGSLWALGDVAAVEKLIRQTLVDPIIEKIMRGEKLSKEEQGEDSKAADEGGNEAVPLDNNIKDYVTRDANIKDARVGLEADLKKVPADLRKRVEKELTAGEKILWIGKPESSQKGKATGSGLLNSLGSLVGKEDRREPEYTLYALTNRRVLLWADKLSRIGSRDTMSFILSDDPRGPISYYGPHLDGAGLEEDKNGVGSILFKQVKVVITTKTTDKRGHVSYKKQVQMHYLGVLHIRKFREVARLMYETLIAPCRGR